jgi:RHH-type proline utilization regulon transcriptional repressor/proline dehydrogenase/delta 1-pyrroline-5-carboxylate dehydrogenase
VNRNLIGAVVGVQPFGGRALSGTGPKAGGPLYLYRLLSSYPAGLVPPSGLRPVPAARLWADHLGAIGSEAARPCAAMAESSPVGTILELPGPVGEQNRYALEPRGRVLCVAETPLGLQLQIGAALATGNRALVDGTAPRAAIAGLPARLADDIAVVEDRASAAFEIALFDGDEAARLAFGVELAARPGPIVTIHLPDRQARAAGGAPYRLEWLLAERSTSINTAASGGNASLMSIG